MDKTNSCIHVALKEFVEKLIEAESKLTETKLKGMDSARDLQAKEYARRLTELNHAHAANLLRNAEFIGKEKFESFEREFRTYKEANDKAVESKAKAVADAVEQKALAATQAVDTKATAVKKEFDEYKMTQATAVSLAAGSKQGMSKIGAIVVTLVGVVASLFWAASLIVNVYLALRR
jgi:hypothetical protein